MKKITNIIVTVFGIGVMLCLFAGGLAFIGFVIAGCIGGETATEICVFIHKVYFPVVIRITSIVVGMGLIGMYMGRVKALSISKDDSAEKTESN